MESTKNSKSISPELIAQNKPIGERIAELRNAKGEKQEDLAKALNISNRKYIAEYETGAKTISARNLALIAKHYGVSTDYLLGLTDIQSTDITEQAVCKYLGLSESAVRNLAEYNKNELYRYGVRLNESNYYLKGLDAFLSSQNFDYIAQALGDLAREREQAILRYENGNASENMLFAITRDIQTARGFFISNICNFVDAHFRIIEKPILEVLAEKINGGKQ